MLRLSPHTHHRPGTVQAAVAIASEHGPKARYVAGGTDLYPNMKRRHQTPEHVVSLAGVRELVGTDGAPAQGLTIGAMTTLRAIERDAAVLEHYPMLAHAVREISTPLLRNMGTIGGNLLLDTRCTYYNQTHEWRESIDFCMKEQGSICWVAPGSPRCWAVQSSDTVPLLTAMGAEVTLVGTAGERRIPCADLYQDDGIAYTTKKPDELLTQLHLPARDGTWKAAYLKLRRRGTFDFPVLGVGVFLQMDGDTVVEARIRIGGTGSMAAGAPDAEKLLAGQKLTDELIAEAATKAFKPTRPMDNTDHEVRWRKQMAPVFVARALRAAQ